MGIWPGGVARNPFACEKIKFVLDFAVRGTTPTPEPPRHDVDSMTTEHVTNTAIHSLNSLFGGQR